MKQTISRCKRSLNAKYCDQNPEVVFDSLQTYSTAIIGLFRLTVGVLAMGVFTVAASASTYVYEGFNGYSTGQLYGQNISANSVGVNGTVQATGTTTVYYYDSTGLSFSNLQVSGGSAKYNSTGLAAALDFNYGGSTVTGTLYTSYLINFGTAQNTNSVATLRVNTTPTSSGGTAYFQSTADTVTGTTTGNGYGNTVSASSVSLNTGTTYLVLGVFTNVGASLSSANPGIGTTYVLTASQFDWFNTNGGLSDSALASATVGNGDGSVTSAISSSATTGVFSLVNGNGIQFGLGNAANAAVETAWVDEIRFGSSLADVAATVPEPSSLALGGIACGILFAVRAFRKRTA